MLSLPGRTGVLVSILLAGCLGATENGDSHAPIDDSSTPIDGKPGSDGPLDAAANATGPVAFTWGGYLKVGAIGDIPAHIEPTASVTHDSMNVSFILDVLEVPEAMRVKVEWTAQDAEFELMVTEPFTDSVGGNDTARNHILPVNPYSPGTDWFTADSPICMEIEAEYLRTGQWAVMVHSSHAVEAQLNFTVEVTGGQVELINHHDARDSVATFLWAFATKENIIGVPCS
jgi:hypothetical protein